MQRPPRAKARTKRPRLQFEFEMAEQGDEYERIWKIYCELGVIERHFGSVQSNYRALASTWLLAAFAGVGFVISKDLTLRIPIELLVAAIGIAASLGVYLLWVLDLLVCQRLLDSSFIESKNLETSHNWLPQVRNNMRVLLRGKGLSLVGWYYIAGTEVMFTIAGIGLIRFFVLKRSAGLYVVLLSYMAIFVMIPIHMRKQVSTTPKQESEVLDARIKHMLDETEK